MDLLCAQDQVVERQREQRLDGVDRPALDVGVAATGQVTVLVRLSERPTTIELSGAENKPSQFLNAKSLKLTFEGWDLTLPLNDRADGLEYAGELLRIVNSGVPRRP